MNNQNKIKQDQKRDHFWIRVIIIIIIEIALCWVFGFLLENSVIL